MKLQILRQIRKCRYRLANLGNSNGSHTYVYYGVPIHHTPQDKMVQRTLDEGIFESDVVKTIRQFLQSGTTYLDIGANIGLLSVQFLNNADLTVHSFEPGPSTFPLLQRSATSAANPRWNLHELALGSSPGTANFHTAGNQDAALAGLRDTGRNGGSGIAQVKVETLDHVWYHLGEPSVSVIKIDVEGGELDVFSGGSRCIRACLPAIITEIDPANFHAYDQTAESIFAFVAGMDYGIFHLPNYSSAKPRFTQIHTVEELRANLRYEINFLLLPSARS